MALENYNKEKALPESRRAFKVNRISINASTVKISPQRNFVLLAVGFLWLYACIGAGLAGLSELFFDNPGGSRLEFLLVWLNAFRVSVLLVGYIFLWNAFGQERVTVQQGRLSIRRYICGLPVYARHYEISRISNLRAIVQSMEGGPLGWLLSRLGLYGGAVAFAYNGQPKRFGLGLEEKEAWELVAEMSARFGL